jgi:tetratricopeptide (TPR) repeat protein
LTAAIAAGVFGLAFDKGGYALTTRNAVAIGVWWTVAIAAALALLPRARIPRAALFTGALLALFAAWTALSIAWADSAEGAFSEFNRVTLYLGVFALAVLASTRASLRRFSDGLAIGIVAIGLLALMSRLFRDLVNERNLFQFLPGGENRLSYPLDYWNGLGIFVGLAFPLLLGIAAATQRAIVRALAVAPLPALTATVYLTSSRGGAGTLAVGTLVFLALTDRRLTALGIALCAAAGSAAVVAVLGARPELVDGPLQSAAAAHQGHSAAVLIALICVVTGAALALASRFGRRPIRLGAPARRAIAAVAVAAAIAGVVAVNPVQRFNTFKKSPTEFKQAQTDFTRAHLLSGSGSGRWQFWSAAVDEFESKPLIGRGAGSYQAWWARHGSLYRFIRNAHSLYLETLAELGLVGLALLAAVLFVSAGTAVRRLMASRGPQRVTIASLVALVAAWCLAAGIDWMWELTAVTVVAVASLGLLTGPATAGVSEPRPRHQGARQPGRLALLGSRYPWARLGVAALAVAVIVTQGIPFLAQIKVRDSQAAVARGDAVAALDAARDAHRIQPWAASPDLQLALVREQTGDLGGARSAIGDAIGNDPSDWRLWLVRARLETKAAAIPAARRSLQRARKLNPRSPVFASR